MREHHFKVAINYPKISGKVRYYCIVRRKNSIIQIGYWNLFGIKKGTAINLRGYVQSESELSGWIDFEKYSSTNQKIF
ncbi:hypothetical protein HZA38_02660 [Candidatus Peregrinibacteria bacterium]|nr:hypothetical protein [Candidatus Peregrinibacteria bacterium]